MQANEGPLKVYENVRSLKTFVHTERYGCGPNIDRSPMVIEEPSHDLSSETVTSSSGKENHDASSFHGLSDVLNYNEGGMMKALSEQSNGIKDHNH